MQLLKIFHYTSHTKGINHNIRHTRLSARHPAWDIRAPASGHHCSPYPPTTPGPFPSTVITTLVFTAVLNGEFCKTDFSYLLMSRQAWLLCVIALVPLANVKNHRDNSADSPGFSKRTMTYLREREKKNNLEPFFSISTSLIPLSGLNPHCQWPF